MRQPFSKDSNETNAITRDHDNPRTRSDSVRSHARNRNSNREGLAHSAENTETKKSEEETKPDRQRPTQKNRQHLLQKRRKKKGRREGGEGGYGGAAKRHREQMEAAFISRDAAVGGKYSGR